MKRVNMIPVFTATETKKIVNLYTKKRQTLNTIAATFGVGYTTIRRVLTENGITIRKPGRQLQTA